MLQGSVFLKVLHSKHSTVQYSTVQYSTGQHDQNCLPSQLPIPAARVYWASTTQSSWQTRMMHTTTTPSQIETKSCMLDGCMLDGCMLDGCVLDGCMLDGCMLDGCMLDG